jgi:hypothetical protein
MEEQEEKYEIEEGGEKMKQENKMSSFYAISILQYLENQHFTKIDRS